MTQFRMTARDRRRTLAVRSSALLVFLFAPPAAAAQVIAVKTLPIADADQFSFFPSLFAGMGDVRIALADSIHDPFVNPATAARLRYPLVFSAPAVFTVSGDAGRGRTYPLGILGRRGASFGGAAVAIQSITEAQPLGAIAGTAIPEGPSNSTASSRSNNYGFLMLGHTFAASKLSVGASAFWSDLGTVDGTSLLYAGSRGVNQAGRAADLRLGMLKEWKRGQSLEALVFNRRVGMTHDITYGDLYWDPVGRRTIIRDRLEHERDRTNAWGMHLEYTRPIGDSGWRAGVIATANRLNNPSRPAYEIETVPGDRGRASAFNVGVGLARAHGLTTFAVDAIYEPITSRIWGVSDTIAATNGTIVQQGDKTIESRLRFSNAILRTGASRDLTLSSDTKLQLQLGVQARSIYYTFDQRDLLHGAARKGNENWIEWTRSWGAKLRRASFELHYRGRTTTGAGRPGVDPVFGIPVV